jgi:hypothetical protein
MKTIKQSLLAVLFVAVLAFGCKKDDFPSGTTGAYYAPESIQGNWTLQSITQVDEGARSLGFPSEIQSLDLKTVYNYDGFKAQFDNLGADSIGNFTITNPNNAPAYMPTSGKWSFRTESGPVTLLLAGSDTTYNIDLKPAYRPADNKLSLYVSRKVEGVPVVSYVYSFTR